MTYHFRDDRFTNPELYKGGSTMPTTAMIPALLAEFRDNIRIFKGMPKTDQNRAAAAALIDQYAGRLQLLDLTMSQGDARATLRCVYLTL